MIIITRLNKEALTINAQQIESIEQGADTCIVMMNGKRLFVRESEEDIMALIRAWYMSLSQGAGV